jgi:hypothetical protein
MIVGVGFYSITLGDITSLIFDLDQEAALLTETLTHFEDITRNCEVPAEVE